MEPEPVLETGDVVIPRLVGIGVGGVDADSEVGTANFTDPFACPRIIRELDAYCDRQKVQRAQELVGTLAEY